MQSSDVHAMDVMILGKLSLQVSSYVLKDLLRLRPVNCASTSLADPGEARGYSTNSLVIN